MLLSCIMPASPLNVASRQSTIQTPPLPLKQVGINTNIKRKRQHKLEDNSTRHYQYQTKPYRCYLQPIDNGFGNNNRPQATDHNAYPHTDIGKVLLAAPSNNRLAP
jgi:hypothetical protein